MTGFEYLLEEGVVVAGGRGGGVRVEIMKVLSQLRQEVLEMKWSSVGERFVSG